MILAENTTTRTCVFFLRGHCKFGDKCYNYHPSDPLYKSISSPSKITLFSIRHGESKYNRALQRYTELYGPDATCQHSKTDFQYDESLLDAPLTETGILQAKEAGLSLKKQRVQLVFVSPLERTLQTADIIFEGRNVKVMVIPQITQIFSKICDISEGILEKKKRYPHFDFSLFEDIEESWQSMMLGAHHQEEVRRLATYPDGFARIKDYYISLMKQKFPAPMEPHSECTLRVLQAVKDMKSICEREGVRQAAVVVHRRVLREMTKSPANPIGISFDNCEMKKIYV